jgi:hypothetical protein
MAKQAYVYSGTDWVPLASEVTNLSSYYTSAQVDILDAPTGLKLLVPTSVAVGSGTGTVGSTGTVTFTGASSVSLNGVFTSTYDDYFLTIASSGGSAVDMRMRLRAAGVDESSSNYARQRFNCFSTSGDSERSTAQTSVDFGSAVSSKSNIILTLFKPKVAETTTFISTCTINVSSPQFLLYSGGLNNSTSYDSLTIFPASGTITGTVSVYGYKK